MNQVEFDNFFKRYKELLPKFKLLKDEGDRTLKKATNRIKVHSITSRIKGFDSCLKKVIDKKIDKPFKSIKDFVGLRVVCLFLADLDKVEKVINETFEVVGKKDKINSNKKDVFGYMGKHFIVKLKAGNETNTTPFEIQVRTIAQDAWASVSHHLDYKTNSIPEELVKDFYALSGLFYVADTHFSFMRDKSEGIEITT